MHLPLRTVQKFTFVKQLSHFMKYQFFQGIEDSGMINQMRNALIE